VSELFEDKNLPIEIIEKSNLIHTENGLIKIEIIANKIERFVDDSPRLLFSDGFEVVFYDDSSNVISNLKGKNAIVDEINNIMIASSSVVLSNKTKTLETEYLVWDEKKDKIYTENDVIITTEKEKIYAKGFSSDPNFNDYTLNKISGKMYISEIE
jgi:LPS export ABC transporter protein LptC